MPELIYVGGSKGGVGKSLVSIALVDWFRKQERDIILVEGDGANSDTYHACKKIVPTHALNFDVADGWDALGDLAERTDDATIIVNSGARMIDQVNNNGFVLEELAKAGVIELATMWPINRSRDSVKALKDYRKHITSGRVVVIRNLYFGEPSKFTRWEDSATRKALAAEGVLKVGDLPELSDRVIDSIYDDRRPIEMAREEASITDRARIDRWRDQTHGMLKTVLA